MLATLQGLDLHVQEDDLEDRLLNMRTLPLAACAGARAVEFLLARCPRLPICVSGSFQSAGGAMARMAFHHVGALLTLHLRGSHKGLAFCDPCTTRKRALHEQQSMLRREGFLEDRHGFLYGEYVSAPTEVLISSHVVLWPYQKYWP